ncbi:MAG TPA: ABC transporter ATP-binding protein [Chloroflexota bacterium]|nr:ABC transporter ATP-binding protein [Chloroflexota bacterium]
MSTLLEAHQVSKIFGGGLFDKRVTVALDDFSFAIESEPPRVTAIVGESGSGKTTLARLLLGLVSPTTGQVRYNGTDLQKLPKQERRAFLRDVQMIFQDPYEVYNPFYRVDHVLETPIAEFKLANSPQAGRALMQESLRAVGLRPDETLGRYPHQLSGGQRQRIMVARALLIRPRLIIADEPVSMVDASLRATILDNLRQLNREYGISIIYITHDLTTAFQISDNIIVLYRGAVAEAGDVDLVVKQPKHPYTQLLIKSVPEPDPNHAWGSVELTEAAEPTNGAATVVVSHVAAARQHGGHLIQGCTFADRCPHVMDMCRQTAPPLFHIDPGRAASCFLYREQGPALSSELLNDVMAAAGSSTRSESAPPSIAP